MFWYLNAAYGAKALADVPFQNYLEPRWHRIIAGLKIIGVIIPFKLTDERDPNIKHM
jgi:hypothetical protein